MARCAVTKTWADRPFDPEFHPNLHETFEVANLSEVDGVAWTIGKYSAWGDNGRCGQSDLVTYIARPISR